MKIVLASKSGVRKDILDKYGIESIVSPSNVDEDQVKEALLEKGADPEIISKNLAELKSSKVSVKYADQLVLGADSVISLNDELINKPNSREDAFGILKKLNNSIETTNFKSLQDIENQGKFGENVYSLKDKRKIKFFYQGPENDWKKNLDKSMIEKMNKYYEKDLKFFKYEI